MVPDPLPTARHVEAVFIEQQGASITTGAPVQTRCGLACVGGSYPPFKVVYIIGVTLSLLRLCGRYLVHWRVPFFDADIRTR